MFDGNVDKRDEPRLKSNLERIRRLMSDHKWRSEREIRNQLGMPPETKITERLRDLRKDKFGGGEVQSVRNADGLWMYRVANCEKKQTDLQGLI